MLKVGKFPLVKFHIIYIFRKVNEYQKLNSDQVTFYLYFDKHNTNVAAIKLKL